MRGRGLLCREVPSLALPPEETWVGDVLGGEAASLREAPLPPDPSLPKSGWRLRRLLLSAWFRLKGGWFYAAWLRSRWLTESPRPVGGGER